MTAKPWSRSLGARASASRALVCAALADGASTVHHLPDGDDTTAMLTALERPSVLPIHRSGATATLTPRRGHHSLVRREILADHSGQRG